MKSKIIPITIGEETREIKCIAEYNGTYEVPYGIIEIKTMYGDKWHLAYGYVTEDGKIHNLDYPGMRGNGYGKASVVTQIRWAE